MKSHQNGVEYCQEPFPKADVSGLLAISENGYKLQLQPFHSSKVSDGPDTEDPLSLRSGSQIVMPCYTYFENKDVLHLCTRARKKNLRHSITTSWKSPETQRERERKREDDDATINFLSMNPVTLAIREFPLVGIYSCVHLYSIFRPKQFHDFFLGVSKLLKECLVVISGNTERTSSDITDRERNGKQLMRTVKPVLHCLN